LRTVSSIAGRDRPEPPIGGTEPRFTGAQALDAHARAQRLRSTTALFVLAACVWVAAHVAQFEPGRLIEGVPKLGDYLARLAPPIRASYFIYDVSEWYWGLGKWLALLGTTLMMALLATTLGTVGGAVVSFFASRNLVRSGVLYWVSRRLLEIARAVPDLVWALIFVFAFGLGPLAGVLAIALHTFGAQGKLFAEVNENIDVKPLEGVRAAGGRWTDEIAYGVLPQVLPNYVSYTLWRLEINVRLAAIIGFVGAGGIGVELYDSISLNYVADVGAILLILAVTIFLIDYISERLRLRLAGSIETRQARVAVSAPL
jgi:phosphonate transport system permease protein